jgi:thiamine biosynthesis lipoprotein
VSRETALRFDCFGGSCGVYVEGEAPGESAAVAAERARTSLLLWHKRFSRFIAGSELSRLNADPREVVPVSALMGRLAATARAAAEQTGGLVDATMVHELIAAGYDLELPPALPPALALALAPPRRPAAPSAERRWEHLEVLEDGRAVRRPPGLMLDSGGLAKGLFADELAATLGAHRSFALDCCGDLALGGAAGVERTVEVESPLDGSILHTFAVKRGGVATSGVGSRSWLGADGLAAHHLLDPASGRPAFTGIVQATALAPTATLAEIHAKAAVLSGPARAAAWLPWGGALVFDDGAFAVLEPSPAPAVRPLAAGEPARTAA